MKKLLFSIVELATVFYLAPTYTCYNTKNTKDINKADWLGENTWFKSVWNVSLLKVICLTMN